jgi:hypothetical protein
MNTTHFHAEERVSISGEFSEWSDIADNAQVIWTESQAVQLAAAHLEFSRCKFNAGITNRDGFNPDRDLILYTSDETAEKQGTQENLVYFGQFKRPGDPNDGGVEDFFQVRVTHCNGAVGKGREFAFSDDGDLDIGDLGSLLRAILGGDAVEVRELTELPDGVKLAA